MIYSTPTAEEPTMSIDALSTDPVLSPFRYRDTVDGRTFLVTEDGLSAAADHAMGATGGTIQIVRQTRMNDYVGAPIFRFDVVVSEVSV